MNNAHYLNTINFVKTLSSGEPEHGTHPSIHNILCMYITKPIHKGQHNALYTMKSTHTIEVTPLQ